MGTLVGGEASSIMKTLLAAFIFCTLGIHFTVALDETFSQTLRVGKSKITCTFTMSYTTTSVTKSKATCTPKKKKIKSTTQTLTAPSGYVFKVTMRINQPSTKIFKAEITTEKEKTEAAATSTTTTTTAQEEEKTEAQETTTTTTAPEKTSTTPKKVKEVTTTTEDPLPGDWVVIQSRGQYGNPGDYFEKTLAEYEAGFEDNGELWLGLEKIAEKTASGTWEMEVEVMDWSGRRKRASYDDFKVGASPRYELTAADYDFTSTLRDGLKYHNGAPFSTIDQDQDDLAGSCAQKYGGGGWWYRSCYHASLNGQNLEGGRGGAKAASWLNMKVKESTMKMRKIAN